VVLEAPGDMDLFSMKAFMAFLELMGGNRKLAAFIPEST